MNNPSSVAALFLQPQSSLLSKVSINAILVICGAEAYLVDSIDNPEHQQRLSIHCPGLESQLDTAVGGWMGGEYSYIDPVFISGTLELGTARKQKLVLSNVDELIISRDGEDVNIFPAASDGNQRPAG